MRFYHLHCEDIESEHGGGGREEKKQTSNNTFESHIQYSNSVTIKCEVYIAKSEHENQSAHLIGQASNSIRIYL